MINLDYFSGKKMAKKVKKQRLDLWVSTMAIVIGISTMLVYIYQARIMSEQQHASVWPYLELNFSQNENSAAITVENKGVGPAIVKKVEIILDGEIYSESKHPEFVKKLLGRSVNYNYKSVESRVMKPGESISFISFYNSQSLAALDSALNNHNVEIVTCYCSIFDDCWIIKNGKAIECDSCEE